MMLHQFFVKLGARYVVVTDTDGYCMFFSIPYAKDHHLIVVTLDEGVIDKKTWLAFLSDLEEKK